MNLGLTIFPILFFLFLAFLFLVYLVQKGSLKKEGSSSGFQNKYLPYVVRKTLMTPAERVLFESLKYVLGSKYDIYPQMKLDKIFNVEYQRTYKYYLGYLRKINQKSIDYLVVNRQTQSPLFGIELDDFSHNYEDRRERDSFVEELFIKTGLPLVRFNPGNYQIEEVKKVLTKYLS